MSDTDQDSNTKKNPFDPMEMNTSSEDLFAPEPEEPEEEEGAMFRKSKDVKDGELKEVKKDKLEGKTEEDNRDNSN